MKDLKMIKRLIASSPDWLLIRRLIYFVLVASFVCVVIADGSFHQSQWIVWSAFFFSLIGLGSQFIYRLEAICLTMAACLCVVWFVEYVNFTPESLAFYLLILTTGLLYLSQLRVQYAYPLMIVNVFAILSSYDPPFVGGEGDRIISICIGLVIVLISQIVFSFRFLRYQWQSYVVSGLKSLKKLNQELFACLLQGEYPDNVYLFENRIRIQKEKFIHAHVMLSQLKLDSMQQAVTKKLNTLYDILVDAGQLRWRLSDHNVAELCSAELTVIEKEMSKLLTEAENVASKNQCHLDISALDNAIQSLEDNYHQVLQVTSREPLVFLLFIATLRAFSEEISGLD